MGKDVRGIEREKCNVVMLECKPPPMAVSWTTSSLELKLSDCLRKVNHFYGKLYHFTRLLGNGRLGSPKWKKQIRLLNTCRPIVPQMCRFFYLGVYNLYFTKLKSRVNLYRNARGKRTVVEREVWYISSLNFISWSRNPPSKKERLLTRFQIQCGPPVLNSNLEGKRKTVQVTAGLS